MRAVEPGVWQAEIDTREVPNGKDALTVTVQSESGSGQESIQVAIANRDGANRVPTSRGTEHE
jgi:hypothetical protein